MDAVLKDDLLREYAINVETDSTIAHNSADEKEQHAQALGIMTNSLQTLMPMISQGFLPADVVIQMVKLAMHPFKQTHAFEDAIAQIPNTQQQFQQMQQGMAQMQQQIGQLTQQNQQLQAKVVEFNLREEIREDLKVEAEAEKDFAQAEKYRNEARRPTAVQGS
jgi:TolA-binding protein